MPTQIVPIVLLCGGDAIESLPDQVLGGRKIAVTSWINVANRFLSDGYDTQADHRSNNGRADGEFLHGSCPSQVKEQWRIADSLQDATLLDYQSNQDQAGCRINAASGRLAGVGQSIASAVGQEWTLEITPQSGYSEWTKWKERRGNTSATWRGDMGTPCPGNSGTFAIVRARS